MLASAGFAIARQRRHLKTRRARRRRRARQRGTRGAAARRSLSAEGRRPVRRRSWACRSDSCSSTIRSRASARRIRSRRFARSSWRSSPASSASRSCRRSRPRAVAASVVVDAARRRRRLARAAQRHGQPLRRALRHGNRRAADPGAVDPRVASRKAGAWVLLSGLLRYAFVAAGAVAPWLRAPLPPSRRRQTICVVQIVALSSSMLPAIEPPASTLLAGGGARGPGLFVPGRHPVAVASRGVRRGALALARARCVLLDASLTFQNVWPTPADPLGAASSRSMRRSCWS